MAITIVPNALAVQTKSYLLCVPEDIYNNPDSEVVFRALVIMWVFTAWLTKRFPNADPTDIAMWAGLAAWKPTSELMKLLPEMERKYPGHPKTRLNRDLLECLHNSFTMKRDATPEEFAEAEVYNTQAIDEVDALFPCTCGKCERDHQSN